MHRTIAICLLTLAFIAQGSPVFAQAGPPGSSDGMPWQVGALFTGHWVIVAIAIAMLSKPSKRLDKPKKREGEIES